MVQNCSLGLKQGRFQSTNLFGLCTCINAWFAWPQITDLMMGCALWIAQISYVTYPRLHYNTGMLFFKTKI